MLPGKLSGGFLQHRVARRGGREDELRERGLEGARASELAAQRFDTRAITLVLALEPDPGPVPGTLADHVHTLLALPRTADQLNVSELERARGELRDESLELRPGVGDRDVTYRAIRHRRRRRGSWRAVYPASIALLDYLPSLSSSRAPDRSTALELASGLPPYSNVIGADVPDSDLPSATLTVRIHRSIPPTGVRRRARYHRGFRVPAPLRSPPPSSPRPRST